MTSFVTPAAPLTMAGLKTFLDAALADLNSRLPLLNTLTASSSANLSDTTSFTAAYDDYMIALDNLVPATNAATFAAQIQSGGAFKTTGYINNSALTSAVDLCNSTALSSSAGVGSSGIIYLHNVNLTSVNKMIEGRVAALSAGAVAIAQVGGYWNGGQGAVTGLQFAFSAGNIATGKIRIYGIKPS